MPGNSDSNEIDSLISFAAAMNKTLPWISPNKKTSGKRGLLYCPVTFLSYRKASACLTYKFPLLTADLPFLFSHLRKDFSASCADVFMFRIGVYIRSAFPAAFTLFKSADGNGNFHRSVFRSNGIHRSGRQIAGNLRLGNEAEIRQFFSMAFSVSKCSPSA